MSSLIFYADENQALVATDTLATSPDGKPFKFTTKTFIVPHLKLLMSGVGVHGFLGKWFVQMNDGVVVRGIDHLNYHAPRILASLWQRYKKELSIPDNIKTTIYHVGFSEITEKIHLYAYRSTEDFTSERLEPYGIRVKPECPVPENYCLPQDIRTMMDDQRAIQASKPKSERIYIGGEIEIHHLTKGGSEVYTLHRFEDYSRDEMAIYDNFRDAKSD
jgi:hypothetical protein